MSMHSKNCVSSCNISQFGCEQTLEEIDFERSIYYACVNGDLGRVKKFIDQDRKWVNHLDKHGYSALHYAARNNFIDICKYLLENGADVHAKTKSCQSTALHRACLIGNFEIVKLLLNFNSNIFEKDSDLKTPFHRSLEQYIIKNDIKFEKILKLIIVKDPRIIYEKDKNNKSAIELFSELINWVNN